MSEPSDEAWKARAEAAEAKFAALEVEARAHNDNAFFQVARAHVMERRAVVAEAAYADLRATSIATLRFQESERAEAAEARLAALLQSARDLVEDADNRALSASEMLNMLDGWVTRHSAPAQPGQPKADP